MRTPAFRPLLTALVAAVLLTPAGRAAAQPSDPGAYTYGSVSHGTLRCDYEGAAFLDERNCVSGGARTRVYGKVDADGALHAGAWIEYEGSYAQDWYASGTAGFVDRMTFDGVIPTFVEFTLSLHGRVSNEIGSHALSLKADDPTFEGSWRRMSFSDDEMGPGWNYKEETFRVWPVAGAINYALQLSVGAQTNAFRCPDDDGPCIDAPLYTTRGAYSDFSNTARILGVRGYDAEGNDITDQMHARSALGHAYATGAAPVSTVPEPATVALLGAGLLGVAAAARRTRAA
jgi:hypothetical protein